MEEEEEEAEAEEGEGEEGAPPREGTEELDPGGNKRVSAFMDAHRVKAPARAAKQRIAQRRRLRRGPRPLICLSSDFHAVLAFPMLNTFFKKAGARLGIAPSTGAEVASSAVCPTLAAVGPLATDAETGAEHTALTGKTMPPPLPFVCSTPSCSVGEGRAASPPIPPPASR